MCSVLELILERFWTINRHIIPTVEYEVWCLMGGIEMDTGTLEESGTTREELNVRLTVD